MSSPFLNYNRFAKTPYFKGGDEGKARFQASPQNAGKAVESLRVKTPPFQGREAYKWRKVKRKETKAKKAIFKNSFSHSTIPR